MKAHELISSIAACWLLMVTVVSGDTREIAIEFKGDQTIAVQQMMDYADWAVNRLRQPGQDETDANDVAYYVSRLYRLQGFRQVEVTYELIPNQQQVKQVIFHVKAGPQVQIKEVIFTGNQAVTELLLQSIWNNSWRQNRFADPKWFNRSLSQQAAQAIVRYYRQQGYLDMQLKDVDYQFDKKSVQASITVRVVEGPRYRIGSIHFSGDAELVSDAQKESLRKKWQQQPLNDDHQLLLSREVKQHIMKAGYPDGQVSVTIDTRQSPEASPLTVKIDSGPKVTIADIVIKGATYLDRRFIAKYVMLEQGDVYSPTALDQTFTRLFHTDLFSTITVDMEAGTQSARALIVTVKEKPRHRIFTELGWGSYQLGSVAAGYRHLNLDGQARQLDIESGLSFKDRYIEVGVKQRHVIIDFLTTRYSGYSKYRIEPAYTQLEHGLGIGFFPWLNADMDLELNYTLRLEEVSNTISDNSQETGQVPIAGTAGLFWYWENRNNLLFPRSGHFITAGLELVDEVEGLRSPLAKLNWEAAYYWPLFTKSVAAARLKGGLLWRFANKEPLKISDRFFNGGENSVRSFAYSTLGPKDPNGKPLGGAGFNIVNLSWRQHVTGSWYLNFFADAGNLIPVETTSQDDHATSSWALNQFFDQFNFALGLGVHYMLPIGALRLEIAFNPAPKQDDAVYQWWLSLGTAF